jgi:hypothetical protein
MAGDGRLAPPQPLFFLMVENWRTAKCHNDSQPQLGDSSRNAAKVNSQGRQPLENGSRENPKPQRGVSALATPLPPRGGYNALRGSLPGAGAPGYLLLARWA